MNIRAKMKCTGATKTELGSEQVLLEAVTEGSEENKSFAQYTPAAQFNMLIDNPQAHGAFEPGREYYVDFSPAD